MRITSKWQGGLKFVSANDQGHQTIFDVTDEKGNSDGPTPVQVFLEALATCSAIDIVVVLNKRRLKIDSFKCDVEAKRANEHPKIFTDIRINFIISGDGINDREMRRAINLSRDKLCSLLAIIDKSKTQVSMEYEIV